MRRKFESAKAFVFVATFVGCALPLRLSSQTQVRKPYPDPVVVEESAVIVSLKQQTRWRPALDGKAGFYSWRIDANAAQPLGIALAADTMFRVFNLAQVVKGSSLRKCAEGAGIAARNCVSVLRDTVGVNGDYIQIILRDTSIVRYFREVRPGSVRSTTLDPHGRFQLDRFRVLYRDISMRK